MTREEVAGKYKSKKRSHDKSPQKRIPSRMAKGAFERHSQRAALEIFTHGEGLTEMFHSPSNKHSRRVLGSAVRTYLSLSCKS